MKLKKYVVVESGTADGLAEQINSLLANGWILQGGVSFTQETRTWTNERKGYEESETDTVYIQAMVLPWEEI